MKDKRYLDFQATLEKMAAGLTLVDGYDRLIRTIKRVASWDEYMGIRAQIETAQWFKENGLIKEIEPKLPHREGYSDILLSTSEQVIYCEVTSLESLQKSVESKEENEAGKIQNLLRKERWMSETEAKHEIKISRIARILLGKTNHQLPPDRPGILALETGKAMVFHFDVKKLAEKLFPSRLQVMLIMLWSLEKGSQIGKAPFWFINYRSPLNKFGQKLLEDLKQTTKVLNRE